MSKTKSVENIANKTNILGVGVTSTSIERVLEIFKSKISNSKEMRPFFVVTAYSEFALRAQTDPEFKQALEKADLIVPDGVSLVAAADYLNTPNLWGLQVGLKILRGQFANQVVSGVGLVKKLLVSKHKLFLLGGWNRVAERLAKRYNTSFDDFTNEELALKKITKTKPDILLVALGHFRQEKWIAKNLDKLKCKVVIGVGSAFDEIAGDGKWARPVPAWVSRMGLKWLWRVFIDPRHIIRAWHAFPVFAWKVFLQKMF